MKWLIVVLVFSFLQDVPYKPKEEFEVKLDYQFKQRPPTDRNAVHLDETRQEYERRTSTAILPYLVLNIKMLKVSPEEVRVKVSNNLDDVRSQKKITTGGIVQIDMGFTADIKDRITAHHYIVSLLSQQRKELSKIVILVEEDGSFLVNGEKRGRL